MKSLTIIAIAATITLLQSSFVQADGWLSKATGGRVTTPSSIQQIGNNLRPKLIDQPTYLDRIDVPDYQRNQKKKASQRPFGDGSDFWAIQQARQRQQQQRQAQKNRFNSQNQVFQQRQQMWQNLAQDAERLKHQFMQQNYRQPNFNGQFNQPNYNQNYRQPNYNTQYNQPNYNSNFRQPNFNQPQYGQQYGQQNYNRRW